MFLLWQLQWIAEAKAEAQHYNQRYQEYKGVMPSEVEYMVLCSTVPFNPEVLQHISIT